MTGRWVARDGALTYVDRHEESEQEEREHRYEVLLALAGDSPRRAQTLAETLRNGA